MSIRLLKSLSTLYRGTESNTFNFLPRLPFQNISIYITGCNFNVNPKTKGIMPFLARYAFETTNRCLLTTKYRFSFLRTSPTIWNYGRFVKIAVVSRQELFFSEISSFQTVTSSASGWYDRRRQEAVLEIQEMGFDEMKRCSGC